MQCDPIRIDLWLFSGNFFIFPKISFWTCPPILLIVAPLFFSCGISTKMLSFMFHWSCSFLQHDQQISIFFYLLQYSPIFFNCFWCFFYVWCCKSSRCLQLCEARKLKINKYLIEKYEVIHQHRSFPKILITFTKLNKNLHYVYICLLSLLITNLVVAFKKDLSELVTIVLNNVLSV